MSPIPKTSQDQFLGLDFSYSKTTLAGLERVRSNAWSFGHSDPNPSSGISSNHAHVKFFWCSKSIFRVLIGFSHGRNQLCRLWEMFHYKKWKKVIRYCIQVNQPADSISCLNTHDRKNKIDFQYVRTTYICKHQYDYVWCLHVNTYGEMLFSTD